MVSTVVAIVLGVAFMAGTFVLTDTLDRVFDDLFADFGQQTDAQVRGEVIFSDPFTGDQRQPLDQALVEKVAAVDGVAGAAPFVTTFGAGSNNRVLGSDGKPLGASQGPPTLLESWIEDPQLSSYKLVEGHGPEADDQIALNTAAAKDGDLSVGDDVVVVTQFGRSTYTLVGTFNFGSAESAAGAVSADFTLAEAQRIAGLDGQIQHIDARADDGLSQQQLVERIQKVVPDDMEVITGEKAAADLSASVQSGFSFFKQALLIFAGIALLVGIFVISNTFAILVSQRTRELALLRAVGASRAQVLGSMMFEATVVGLVAAALGLLAGVGLAKGVTALLDATGADLPTTSLVVRPSTVLAALLVGLVVTLIAALVPAIRATRVPPLAALRDVAIDRSGASKLRLAFGVVVLAVGGLLLSAAWTSDGDTDAVPGVGLGAVLIIIGAIVIGPVLAGPTVRVLGAWLPRLKGVTGRLARENAARSPRRTSATASALIIGVALVAFITVFAASAKESVSAEVERGFTGDFVIQSDTGFGGMGGFPAQVAEEAAQVKGVDTVVGVGFGQAEFTYPDGKTATQFVTSIDPDGFTDVLEPRMLQGEVSDLTDGGVIVDRQLAEDHDVKVGDRIAATFAGGTQIDLDVQALSDDQSLLGYFTITRSTYASVAPEQVDVQVFGTVTDGADDSKVIAAVE
jgi:putative ABC transport system permease protein